MSAAIPGDASAEMRFADWFSHGLERGAELLADRRWGASHQGVEWPCN